MPTLNENKISNKSIDGIQQRLENVYTPTVTKGLHMNRLVTQNVPTNSKIELAPLDTSVAAKTIVSPTYVQRYFDQYTKMVVDFEGPVILDMTFLNTLVNSGAVLDATHHAGTQSAYFNGSAKVSTTNDTQFITNASDFTAECWIKRGNILTTRQGVFGDSYAGGAQFINLEIMNNHLQTWLEFGTETLLTSSILINDTDWHHVALVRYGNLFSVYQDGVLGNSTTVIGSRSNNGTGTFALGSLGSYDCFFNGYIDSFIWTLGLAKYTAPFTPI